jgi:hypothetical protein
MDENKTIGAHRALPSVRKGFTLMVTIGGHKVSLRTCEYEDRTLGSVEIDMSGASASLGAMARATTTAITIGLQRGVPLSIFVDAFTSTKCDPCGRVTGSDHIEDCTSLLDYVVRELAIRYPDQANGQGSADIGVVSLQALFPALTGDAEQALCARCGKHAVDNHKCHNCGAQPDCDI